jgi:hypothetical protein
MSNGQSCPANDFCFRREVIFCRDLLNLSVEHLLTIKLLLDRPIKECLNSDAEMISIGMMRGDGELV